MEMIQLSVVSCQSTASHGFGRELSGSRYVVVFHHFNVNGLPSRAD